MQTSLEELLQSDTPDFRFTDAQVAFMLQNVGSLDPHLRDDLIYSLFARGFAGDAFTKKQVETIIATFINEENLFSGIDEPENDLVFLRTFSALLGSLLLEKDNEQGILTDKKRQILFDWSIAYLVREKDYRGFVPGKGWAHAVAHGSDLLGAALGHNDFAISDSARLYAPIETIFHNMQAPFVDDEEQRLAYAFYQGVSVGNVAGADFKHLICRFDDELYQQLDWQKQSDWYRLSSWLRLLQNWYFFFSRQKDIQDLLADKIYKYYEKMGYDVCKK